jgi:hypothetical protein
MVQAASQRRRSQLGTDRPQCPGLHGGSARPTDPSSAWPTPHFCRAPASPMALPSACPSGSRGLAYQAPSREQAKHSRPVARDVPAALDRPGDPRPPPRPRGAAPDRPREAPHACQLVAAPRWAVVRGPRGTGQRRTLRAGPPPPLFRPPYGLMDLEQPSGPLSSVHRGSLEIQPRARIHAAVPGRAAV